MMSKYRPLPPQVTVSPSEIDGLGLHSVIDLEAARYLGISHILASDKDSDWVRTPLGGFINHSEEPNAVILICDTVRLKRKLYTIRPIKAGEEITIYYTLYYPFHKEV